MAVQWSTYNIGWPGTTNGGLHELLFDKLTRITPEDTMVFSMLPKEDINQVEYNWLIDALDATATGGVAEGADFGTANGGTITSRVRLTNNVQIQRRDFEISYLSEDIAKKGGVAGTNSEVKLQLGKKLIELRRDINARIVANGTATINATGLASAASRTGVIRSSAFSVIATNMEGAFTTAKYATIRESMDDAGALPDTLFVSSGVKADISNLILNTGGAFGLSPTAGGMRRVNMDQVDETWKAVIDIMEDDFGRVMIVRDRFIPQSSASSTASAGTAAAFLVERAKLAVCFVNGIRHLPMPPAGTAHRHIVEAVWGFKVYHPSAVGVLWSLTT